MKKEEIRLRTLTRGPRYDVNRFGFRVAYSRAVPDRTAMIHAHGPKTHL